MSTQTSPRPVHVGIFDTVQQAEGAVSDLLAAGFTTEQITVVCSEEAVKKQFRPYEHQDPAGTNTPAAAATGGVIGAALGGMAAVAGLATGGVVLLVAGGMAMWGGGVVGGLVGAMMTRGVEKELANFYDQSVLRGQILVAAEQADPQLHPTLADADAILRRHGSQPLPLREG